MLTLRRDLQKRLDKYLSDRIGFMSRNQLQRLIDEGGVIINGRKPKASTIVRINDRIEVFVPPPPATEAVPENIPLTVLHEDRWIIVLNKSPDIIVHPARSHLSGTLINALAWHFQHNSSGSLSGVGKEFARPGVIHRLDRHTSGVIVFAKDDESHWKVARQFEERTVDKRYLALIHGLYHQPIDVIDLPLGPHPSREKGYREKYVVRHDELGKPSVTICRVRRQFRLPEAAELDADHPLRAPGRTGGAPVVGAGFCLVELELKTGRTHQIRVHLSHLNHPIVGDDMYGGLELAAEHLAPPFPAPVSGAGTGGTLSNPLMLRQALHAATLSFNHPITNERLHFAAPFPADMRATLQALHALDPEAAQLDPPGASVSLAGL